MIRDTLDELKAAIEKAKEALQRELAKIRTGRANPAIFDSVRVDYYGSMTPLKQLASISVPEARMIILKPFDRATIKAIETAIVHANMGLNPSNDGEVIRVPMPQLTEERRRDLTKVARAKGEDCKVSIRAARHDAKDMFDAMQKDGDVGEDEADRGRKEMEEIVKGASGDVDQLVASKEKAIMAV
ncbi:MAG: ribosome recycling factor [Myxococcota bacterium]